MKQREVLRFGLLLGGFWILLAHPSWTGEATYAGLVFFGKRIFPSLFLSLCLSGMLLHSSLAKWAYRLPFGVESTVMLLGVLCGFPVGAKCARELYEQGSISEKRAEWLCGVSNLASLPFLLGVVGNTLFGEVRFGVCLALLQASGAVFTAIVLQGILKPEHTGVFASPGSDRPTSAAQLIGQSTHTMLEIGGMLIFFGAFAELTIRLTGLQGIAEALLRGGVEFSSGCRSASVLGGTAGKCIAAFSVGLSGLCVAAQVSCVTGGTLSLRPYVLGKLLMSAWMTLGCLLFVK